MSWWKMLASLVWYDITLMPHRVKRWRLDAEIACLDWWITRLDWVSHLLDGFLKRHDVVLQKSEHLVRLEEKNARQEGENRKNLAELMRLYAKTRSGATVHDFNNFWERAPKFYAPRFVLCTILFGPRFWERR